jgi:hypothetical protein
MRHFITGSGLAPAALPSVILTVILLGLPLSAAQAKDGWHGADRPGARALFYGELPPKGQQPNPETIQLMLRCADKGKAVVLFVAETSEKLKPGKSVRVVLSVGKVRSATNGETKPNQLAGVPSLRARFSAQARVFAAMTDRATLRISAGGWQSTTPLNGIDGRLKHLVASCQK